MARKAIKQLQCELQILHVDNQPIKKALEGKLTFALKETVKSIVDGAQPTVETVKELINMRNLLMDILKWKEPRRRNGNTQLQFFVLVNMCSEHSANAK